MYATQAANELSTGYGRRIVENISGGKRGPDAGSSALFRRRPVREVRPAPHMRLTLARAAVVV